MITKEDYRRVQKAPLCWLLYGLAAVFFLLGLTQNNPPNLDWLFMCLGGLMVLLAASFHQLEIVDEGRLLRIRFGPLPLFQRTVDYNLIESVEAGRTSLLDGWGIHFSIRGGWVWNLWGRDCVVLHLRRGRLTIGTDQPAELVEFLRSRIEPGRN